MFFVLYPSDKIESKEWEINYIEKLVQECLSVKFLFKAAKVDILVAISVFGLLNGASNWRDL